MGEIGTIFVTHRVVRRHVNGVFYYLYPWLSDFAMAFFLYGGAATMRAECFFCLLFHYVWRTDFGF